MAIPTKMLRDMMMPDETTGQGFARRLKRLMAERRVTYRELAKALGTKGGTVGGWTKGSIPRGPTLQALADYFGVSRDYLLTGHDPLDSMSGDVMEEVVVSVRKSLRDNGLELNDQQFARLCRLVYERLSIERPADVGASAVKLVKDFLIFLGPKKSDS